MAGVNLTTVGENRPTIKLLNRHVKKEATNKWYDLGIELLENEDVEELNTIRNNHPHDASTCCTEMFQLWLRKQPKATWKQLMNALKQPGIEMNELANNIEQKLASIVQELLSNKSPENDSLHLQSLPVSQPAPSSDVVIAFTQDEDIDCAFTKLSASITTMIENNVNNFSVLKRACIEKAKSPKMVLKSDEIVPIINAAKTFQDLCTMLANTNYWNFLDTRMMEALATASMIPAAQATMENFKRTFFNMKLSDVVPYFPVIPLDSKINYTYFKEDLDKDPTKFTIGDLHKHRFYLETEVLQIGSNKLTISKIFVGSIYIVWQIHYDDVYSATISVKKHSKSSSLRYGINLSFPVMIMWAGLPILWHGQEIKEIGPFSPSLKDFVEEKPYPLLQPELQWRVIKPEDAIKIYGLYATQQYFKWTHLHPNFKDEFFFGIRNSITRKWVWLVRCFTYTIAINGILLPSIFLLQTGLGIDYDSDHDLWNTVQKEMLRRIVVQNGFNQAIMQERQPMGLGVAKPLFTIAIWVYSFQNELLQFPPKSPVLPYNSPKTVGLRRMTSKHVSKAFALTNQYTSKFIVRQVFETEKEFSHYFLCQEMPGFVISYVVTDPTNGDITDMFSLRIDESGMIKIAVVIAIVNTKSPIEQFITDILVCAKREEVMQLFMPQYGIESKIFESLSLLSLEHHGHVYMYNYKYPEVAEDSICLFSHFF